MMKLHQRLRAAKIRYEKDGIGTLSQHILWFLYRHTVRSIIRKRKGSKYHKLMIDSSELKNRAGSRVWQLEDNVRELSTKKIHELIPLQTDPSCDAHNRPFFLFKHPFVAEVRDIRLVGPRPVAMTSEGEFIADTFTFDPYGKAFDNKKGRGAVDPTVNESTAQIAGSIFNLSGLNPLRSISTATILECQSHNYYHWVLEQLPKLRGIKRYEAATDREVTAILPADPPSYLYKFLDRIGHDAYIEWDEGPIHVDRFVVPSFPEPTPGTLKWLRDTLFDTVDFNNSETPKWIYISRQSANGRRVSNFKEVRKVLQKYEVAVVNPESLSLDEEIRLFNAAEGVIGPHGAGLTAMVWGNDLTIVEIFNEVVNAPYYILSDILDYDYHAISGKGIGDGRALHRDVCLDVNKLEAILVDLMQADR